jgi:hypothetical protein
MRMHFVARALSAAWPDLNDLSEHDVAAQAARFRGGVNNWIVQTFLRLRQSLLAAGITPTIGEAFISGCVNLAHRDCLNRLLAPYHRSYVVGVRADRPPVHSCDREIVQNDLEPANARTHFLPFWPQAGLIARDPSRRSRLQRMAYFGRTSAAPAWFYDRAWHCALASMGVVFEIRDDCWFDYSQVDVVLAHRAETPTMLRQKPASKLINAWLARTPALLANEPAYASLRRSGLDYIAIESPADVLAALRQLRSSPAQYAAMVDNGRRRSADYSVESTKARWMRFLLDEVVPAAIAWQAAPRGSVDARITQLARAARQKLAAKRFKLQVFLDLHGSPWLRSIGSAGYDGQRVARGEPAAGAAGFAGPRS